MKKLALIGYGKMGRLIEQLAPENGFVVTHRFDSKNNSHAQGITPQALAGVDVAIEFSEPEAAVSNLRSLAAAGIPAVTGTTGWMQHLDEIRKAFEDSGKALVWSPNFSLGMAVFGRLVEAAASMLQEEGEYGAWAWEIHHGTKKDAPSGTLLQLVEAMHRSGFSRDISMSANRAGHHPGTHEIGFDSAADTITLRHTARNREGFALGALKSAHWVVGKTGVFTFEDMLFGQKR